MENTINDRISHLIELLNLSSNSFASQMDVNTTIIYNIQKGRNKPGFDLLQKITDTFNVNGNWLLNGNGEPLLNYVKNDSFNYVKNDKVNANSNDKVEVKTNVVSGKFMQNSIERNRSFLGGDITNRDSFLYEDLAKDFGFDELNLRLEKLQDIITGYDKRINRELKKNYTDLYNTLEVIGDLEAMLDVINDVVNNYLVDRPNPSEIAKIRHTYKNTGKLPDTIDYKSHKEQVISWLEKIGKYKAAIDAFYEQGERFLQTLKPLDSEGFID
jgi:transcriptional regulator with XRE-family HTH domain